MPEHRFDLAVIGSGPAGQKAAVAAAKAGRRVVIIDGAGMLGGVCLHTGTIPSKTLRESVLHLTGYRHRAFGHQPPAGLRVEDLRIRVDEVLARQREVVRDQLQRNGIETIAGLASFKDAHTLEVATDDGSIVVEAAFVLIACGTRPARRSDLPFDHPKVRDADQILQRVEGTLARSAIVIGGGVIGLEYASMMSALGMATTVIEARDELLGFVDREIIDHLLDHLKDRGVTFRMGAQVEAVRPAGEGVIVHLDSGDTITAESVLYAVGRQPNTDRLNLEATDLVTDRRGRLEVNAHYQTAVPHIYAAGDVIGFPALASTSMEQGRAAACHMFEIPHRHHPDLLPYGIYTIPEVSTVGRPVHELERDGVAYRVGRSFFRELAKAQIVGERTGLLKLVFDPDSLAVLGVHIVGDGAAELVHIGLAAMMAGGTIEDLRDMVFNYPTLAEAYKVAAQDGLNQVTGARDG